MDQDTRGDPPLASKPLQRFVLLRTLTKLLAWFLRFSFSCSLSCPNAPLELFGHDIRRKAEKAEKARRSVGLNLRLRLLVGSVVLRRVSVGAYVTRTFELGASSAATHSVADVVSDLSEPALSPESFPSGLRLSVNVS